MRRLLPFCLVLAVASSSVSLAHAEGPTAAEKASARALANEGASALKKQDFATAFEKYDKASKLMPDAVTLTLGLARAQVGLGKLVEAKEAYNTVIRTALHAGAPPAYKTAKSDAEKEMGPLDARIGNLVITVQGPTADATAVTVDGEPVPALMLGEKRPTNPGERLVRATAPGFRPAENKIVVKEGAVAEVTLALEKDGPKEPPPKIEAPSVPEPEGPPPMVKHPTLRATAWIAAGVGVAGLAAGGVFGYLAKTKHDSLTDACPDNRCAMSQRGDIDSFKSRANLSTVSFIVGGVSAAISVPLFVLSRPSSPTAGTTAVVVTPQTVAVAGSF
jgi:hypothetical protein